MSTGQRGHQSAPWWCRATGLLLAVAASSWAASPTAADDLTGSPSPHAKVALAVRADAGQSSYLVTYSVQDVLSRIYEDRNLRGHEAREFLADLLKRRAGGPTRYLSQPPELISLVWRPNADEMVIRAGPAAHQEIAAVLDALRKFGVAEIVIEVRFIALPSSELRRLLPDRTTPPLQVPEPSQPSGAVQPASYQLAANEGTCVTRAELIVEKAPPARIRILDQDTATRLLDRSQASSLQAPRITVVNGQTAFVSDTSQTPFVVGVKEVEQVHQPQIRVVSEGTTLQLRPTADSSGGVHLDFGLTCSKIRSVETASLGRDADGGPTVQVPEVATARLEGGASLKSGQWLLLGDVDRIDPPAKAAAATVSWKQWLLGGSSPPEREKQFLILMLRATKVPSPPAAPNPAPHS